MMPIEEVDATPLDVAFGQPVPQNRLTVLVRVLLAIPHLVVLYFLGLAAFVIGIIGWFGALFTGRLPRFAVTSLTGWLRWSTRVFAYEYFLTGDYPPFTLDPVLDYPVDLRVQGGRLNRLAVLFRIILVAPAAVVAGLATGGMVLLGVVCWVATLVLGRIPRPFFDASARALRYQARVSGYFYMLTSEYPRGLFGDGPVPTTSDIPDLLAEVSPPGSVPEAPAAPAFPDRSGVDLPGDRELVSGRAASAWTVALSRGGRVVLVLFMVVGALYMAATGLIVAATSSSDSVTAQNEAVDSFNQLTDEAVAFGQSMQGCQAQQDLGCAEQASATLADDIDAYASTLSSIDFPDAVTQEADSAISAARDAASVLEEMAGAGDDGSAFDSASADLSGALTAVDSTFSALNAALISNG